LLIELAPQKSFEKYITMPIRFSKLSVPLLVVLLSASFTVRGDEIKDISQLVSQGQNAQALEKLDVYLATHPNEVQGQFLKGVALAETGKSSDAIRLFIGITSTHPELPEPYNNLAVIYADQGQYDKARDALEMAIRTNPSYATAHENLGDVYAHMASDAYDKALQLDKGKTRTQTKLAMVKELYSRGAARPVQLAAKTVAPPARAAAVPPPAAAAAKPVAPAPVASAPVAAKPEPAKSAVVSVVQPVREPKANPDQVDQKQVLEDTVRGWARAWSAKSVDGYLAYYGAGFKVPGGGSRTAWEKMRRERIGIPAPIKVELSGIRIRMEADGRATVSFRQSYRAGDVAKRTSKSLVLKKGGDKWFIEQELTDR
jgi:hypothetical protein